MSNAFHYDDLNTHLLLYSYLICSYSHDRDSQCVQAR